MAIHRPIPGVKGRVLELRVLNLISASAVPHCEEGKKQGSKLKKKMSQRKAVFFVLMIGLG